MPTRIVALLASCLALLGAAGAASAASSRAADEKPPANEAFPACSDARPTYCVAELSVADPTGAFVPAPAGVEVDAFLFTAWPVYDRDSLVVGLQQPAASPRVGELAPVLPTGSLVRIVLRTGSFEPPPELVAQTDVVSWSRAVDPALGWVSTYVVRTAPYTFALACNVSDGCDAPTDVRTFASYAQLTHFSYPAFQLDGLDAENRDYNLALNAQTAGFYLGTNATGAQFPPAYDPATGAITLPLAGPHLTETGELNEGYAVVFVPDAYVIGSWGADPVALASGNALTVRRTEGDETSLTPATITRVEGGIRIEIRGFHFSAPVFTIGARKALARPASVSVRAGKRRAFVTSATVKRATGYQAVCARGATLVFGTGKKATVTVKGLAPGTWRCRVRGVKGLGGAWSDEAPVRIRA